MKDIPLFTTQNGVGSLALEEIPYKGCAYIRVQSSADPKVFLNECADFCKAAGATHCYATGVGADQFPYYTSVIQMKRMLEGLPESDAAVFPVQENTIEKWCEIYNERMRDVPNAATMTMSKAKALVEKGSCYFVHRQGALLGIGCVNCDRIDAIATVHKGSGKDVLIALCRALTGDTVTVEAATTSQRAIKLYEGLGFINSKHLFDWYQIF